jgi:hypothetical protein
MSVCAIALGSIGILLGAQLDFGQFGLMTFAEWCRVPQPVGLDAIRAQVAAAPWTYLGMLGGCNLGMVLSMRFFDQAAVTRAVFMLRFVGCNAGMILGMLLAEAMRPGSDAVVGDVSAVARMLLVMVLGMAAGMSGGWWCAEWTIRGWRRCTSPAASQHDWRSATGRT